MQIWERCLFLSFQVSVSDEVVFAVSTMKLFIYSWIWHIFTVLSHGLLFFFFYFFFLETHVFRKWLFFAVSTIKIYWYTSQIFLHIFNYLFFIGTTRLFFSNIFFLETLLFGWFLFYILPQKLFLKFVKKRKKWKRTAQHTGKLSEQHGTVLQWIHIGEYLSLHFTIIYWLVNIVCWHLLRYFSILFFFLFFLFIFFMKFSQYTSTKKKFKKIKKSFIT